MGTQRVRILKRKEAQENERYGEYKSGMCEEIQVKTAVVATPLRKFPGQASE